MSIPLDRLYEFVEKVAQNTCNDDVVIYRFWPHGSRKISDLLPLKTYTWVELINSQTIICHDQEPLDFDANNTNSTEVFKNPNSAWHNLLHETGLAPNQFNLRPWNNIFDRCVLLHSEQRSPEVEKYQEQDYVPVYYWSHGLIAQDWFRYAQHYEIEKRGTKQFLVYNRAWTGTREYRVKFAEMLLSHNLLQHCQTWFNSMDHESQTHYTDYNFKNSCWKPTMLLDHVFNTTQATASYSADIELSDYENTDIEIVLETLFDDKRLHLTEKVLRPIACGQPFVLLAAHDSLKYLKEYGFQTYSDVWDESYDQETDPVLRMDKVVKLMETIAGWSAEVRQSKMSQARDIAKHNKQYFFSDKFFQMLTEELQINLSNALTEIETTNTAKKFFANRKRMATIPQVRQILSNSIDHPDKYSNSSFYKDYNRQNILRTVIKARNYSIRKNN
jgi:hypothetical protein